MATETTLIVHPGDIIQGTQQGPQHGHLFLVTETHRWGVGAVARWHDDGTDRETYVRFKPGTFALCGAAAILPPAAVAARRDSLATQRELERERMKAARHEGDGVDYYEQRGTLRQGQVFRTADGSVVELDRGVPGDATRWYVLDVDPQGRRVADDNTVEPGDLVARLQEQER